METDVPSLLGRIYDVNGKQPSYRPRDEKGGVLVQCDFPCCEKEGLKGGDAVIRVRQDDSRRLAWKCLKKGCGKCGDAVSFADRLQGGDGNPSEERMRNILESFDRVSGHQSFVETALRLAGKSEGEIGSLGAVDRADEHVEAMFAPEYQTGSSPIHRAIWEKEFPLRLFESRDAEPDARCCSVMNRSIEVVRCHVREGTSYDADGKLNERLLKELGDVGYWGMLVPKQYGGAGAPVRVFERFLTRMVTEENHSVAMLASVHGCIGAVDPVRTFGTEEQKKRMLPRLARGERLSGFALTEPNAGSDLTAIRTHAELDGDAYVLNGEKLFITNSIPGRTVSVVCMIEGKPALLVVDLPDSENEHFQLKRYGLTSLKHLHNHGLMFRNLRVPKENRITPSRGDGLTAAYHGLNYGRISICSLASGSMRMMLADMLPWARFRKTYGKPIIERELVQKRIGEMAGRIVAADALRDWCSGLLDEGYRGEMECVVAKNFGSESLKYAVIELYMRTHGGRSFLADHPFADVHELLAPSIYEGERDMLNMGFFKSLVKEHGKRYFEPIGRAAQERCGGRFNPANVGHLWAMRKELVPYALWRIGETRSRIVPGTGLMTDPSLAGHVEYAIRALQKSAADISDVMRRYQLSLPDRQLGMTELSQRVQDMVTMLVTALYADRSNDHTVHVAADTLCDELRQRLTGAKPSDAYFRKVTELGEIVATDGRFEQIAGISPGEILMQYSRG